MSSSIHTVEDLSVQFLSSALRRDVVKFSSERIGTGQVGECHRIRLEYAEGQTGLASAVIKLAASGTLSRQSGWRLGIYERESRFYSDIAPTLDGCSSVVKCYGTVADRNRDVFHILLEDISPATVGNDIIGASLEEARLAVQALGTLQGVSLRTTPPDWLDVGVQTSQAQLQTFWKGFLGRYQDRVKPEHREVVERWVSCFDKYAEILMESKSRKCLVHGDYRLDNMLFGHEGGRPVSFSVVDWQMVNYGPVFQDLAFFLGVSVPTETRRAHETELIKLYYDALGPDPPFSLEECIEGVHRQSFLGLPMAFASPMLLEQTDRGDDMFLTMLDRLATYVVDTNAVETLPSPSPPRPLAVDPNDEGAHPASEDPLHNESWYFDVADIEQGIGVWIRLGVTPNQPGSWYNALISGPGRPFCPPPRPKRNTRSSAHRSNLAYNRNTISMAHRNKIRNPLHSQRDNPS